MAIPISNFNHTRSYAGRDALQTAVLNLNSETYQVLGIKSHVVIINIFRLSSKTAMSIVYVHRGGLGSIAGQSV
jgi:hypothetical protein